MPLPRQLEGLPPSKLPLYAYVPLGFRPAVGTGDLVPTYPPGLPLFVVAAHFLVGWTRAGDLILVLHSLAGLAVVFLLGRRFGLSDLWAAIATLIVATSPVYIFMSLQAMTDVPSLVWVTLAVLAAMKSREKTAWALGAGAAISVAVLLRPTNSLMIVPVGIALGLSPKRWGLLILSGIPGAIYWMLYANAAYGSPFTTGYGNVAGAFSRDYLKITLIAYAAWIPTMFTPASLFFVFLPFFNKGRTRENAILVSWGLICPLFYVSYYCTNETWWYQRFLLPSLPAMIVGGLIVMRSIGNRWLKQPSPFVGWAAVCLILISNLSWAFGYEAENIGRGERKYGHVAEWLNANLPADSVVSVMQESGAIYYYTDFKFIRWDMINDGDAFSKVVASTRANHHPLYAILANFEADQAIHTYMPGPWILVATVREVGIYRYEFEHPKTKH